MLSGKREDSIVHVCLCVCVCVCGLTGILV